MPTRVDEGRKCAESSWYKCKTRTVVPYWGGGRRVCYDDPASELRLGGSKTGRAKTVTGMDGKKNSLGHQIYHVPTTINVNKQWSMYVMVILFGHLFPPKAINLLCPKRPRLKSYVGLGFIHSASPVARRISARSSLFHRLQGQKRQAQTLSRLLGVGKGSLECCLSMTSSKKTILCTLLDAGSQIGELHAMPFNLLLIRIA